MNKTSTLFYSYFNFGNLTRSALFDPDALLRNDYQAIKKLEDCFKEMESDVSDDIVENLLKYARETDL